MSKRAEERALEAYPDRTLFYSARECYKKGYEQAEKDLALTADVISDILEISTWLSCELGAPEYRSPGFCELVLTRYKRRKDEQKY